MIRVVIPPTPSIVRKATILIGKARFLLLLTIGFVAGHTLANWQLQTAMKIAWEFGRQQAVMAAQYQRDFPEKFNTTKLEAWKIGERIEKEKGNRESRVGTTKRQEILIIDKKEVLHE